MSDDDRLDAIMKMEVRAYYKQSYSVASLLLEMTDDQLEEHFSLLARDLAMEGVIDG